MTITGKPYKYLCELLDIKETIKCKRKITIAQSFFILQFTIK